MKKAVIFQYVMSFFAACSLTLVTGCTGTKEANIKPVDDNNNKKDEYVGQAGSEVHASYILLDTTLIGLALDLSLNEKNSKNLPNCVLLQSEGDNPTTYTLTSTRRCQFGARGEWSGTLIVTVKRNDENTELQITTDKFGLSASNLMSKQKGADVTMFYTASIQQNKTDKAVWAYESQIDLQGELSLQKPKATQSSDERENKNERSTFTSRPILKAVSAVSSRGEILLAAAKKSSLDGAQILIIESKATTDIRHKEDADITTEISLKSDGLLTVDCNQRVVGQILGTQLVNDSKTPKSAEFTLLSNATSIMNSASKRAFTLGSCRHKGQEGVLINYLNSLVRFEKLYP